MEAWQVPAGCGWPQTLKHSWASMDPDDPHVKGAHFDRMKATDPRKVQCAFCFSGDVCYGVSSGFWDIMGSTWTLSWAQDLIEEGIF